MFVELIGNNGNVLYQEEISKKFRIMKFLERASKQGVDIDRDADILSTVEEINNKFSLGIMLYMLVDDNEDLLKANKNILTKYGHYVKTYADEVLAKDEFQEDPDLYDIVILDNHMPNIYGNELAREFYEQTTKAKIYMFTGYGNDVDVDKEHNVYVLHKGKESFDRLAKPINFDNIGKYVADSPAA